MAGMISEVRARFTATAEGFRTAITGIRQDISGMTNEADSDIRGTNRAFDQFGNAIEQVEGSARGLRNVGDGFRNLGDSADNATQHAGHANSMFKEFRKTIAEYAGAYLGFEALKESVFKLGEAMIGGNADMETYQNTLATVLKSSDKAKEMLAWATQFAASTPFEIPDVVDATVKLQTYGISAKDTLTDIGNMAAITGKPLDQAIEAVADAQTGELERLKEFGITKQMLIDKAASLGKKEVVNAKGQITDMKGLNEALFAIMKDRYQGGMDIASKSFKGIVSNLQDSLGTMARELGKPLFEGLKTQLSNLSPFVTGVTQLIKGDWLGMRKTLGDAFGPDFAAKFEQVALAIIMGAHEIKERFDGLKPTFQNIGTIFSNLMPVFTTVLGALYVGFLKVMDIITPIINYISGLAAKFSKWEGFVPMILGIVAAFVSYSAIMKGITIAQTAFNAIQKVTLLLYNAQRAALIAYAIAGGGVQGVMAALRAAWTVLNATMLANPFVLIAALIIGLGVALYTAYQKSETFRNAVNGAWASIKEGFKAVVDWFTTTIPQWYNNVIKWFQSLWDWMKNFFAQWGTVILAVVAPFIGIPLLIAQHWDEIKTFFANLWSGIISAVSGFVSSIVSWFTNLGTQASGVVSGFVSVLKGYFDNMVTNIMTVIQPFITFFVNSWENLKLLVLGIAGVFTSLLVGDFEGMKLGLLAIWEAIKRQVMNIITTFKDEAIAIFNLFMNGLSVIWNAISSTAVSLWNGLKNGVITVATAIWTGLVNIFTNLKSGVINLINNLYAGAINTWTNLKNGAINIVTGLVNGAISLFTNLKSGAVNLISNMGTSISNGFTNAKNGAINAVTGMYNSVVSWFGNIGKKASSTSSDLIKTFRNIDLTQIGKDIISGLFNGISSMASSVYKKAQEIADGVKSKIKKALGINSPSRVMRGFGVNVGQGLRLGIDDMIGAVSDTAGNMASAVTDNMDMSGALGGVMNGAAKLDSVITLKHLFDFVNLPSNIDIDTLVEMLSKAVGNPKLQQTIDRINYKNNYGAKAPLGRA